MAVALFSHTRQKHIANLYKRYAWIFFKRGASAAVNTARNARKITSAAENIFENVSND